MTELKSLGSGKTDYHYENADSSLLEVFQNPMTHSESSAVVSITAPEFTSLCPITGQPDYATIKILYIPDEYCVESKSLKLYLGSFRMEGMFHEACVNKIATDLWSLLKPMELTVIGEFAPRGGITFWPQATLTR